MIVAQNKSVYSIGIVAIFALFLTGCVQLELSSAADCDENSKIRFCDVCSVYGFDWGKSAQYMLDERLQNNAGRVDERAIQRVLVSQTAWELVVSLGTLGIVRPIEYTLWLEAEK